jgi:hypothetical protein
MALAMLKDLPTVALLENGKSKDVACLNSHRLPRRRVGEQSVNYVLLILHAAPFP